MGVALIFPGPLPAGRTRTGATEHGGTGRGAGPQGAVFYLDGGEAPRPRGAAAKAIGTGGGAGDPRSSIRQNRVALGCWRVREGNWKRRAAACWRGADY